MQDKVCFWQRHALALSPVVDSCAFKLHGALSDFRSDYKRTVHTVFFFYFVQTHRCRVQVSG